MTTPADKAAESFVRNLEAKTGKTVAQWVALARQQGGKHSEIVKWLKAEHGLTHGYANYIALQAKAADAPAPAGGPASDPADEQYAGSKAHLRPIYDKVVDLVQKFGGDVELAPKKGYMSLRRKKQFACLTPTASRVHVGLILRGVKPAGRLEASTNSMFTHRVRVSKPAEVDKELSAWLRKAYDEAG